MLIIPHALAGSAVSLAITSNVFVAFFVGMILHFVLDAIPHFDPGTLRYKADEPNRKPKWGTEHSEETSTYWPKWVYVFVFVDFFIAFLVYFFLFKDLANFAIILAGALGGISIDLIDNPLIRFYKLPIFAQLHWLHHRVHFDLPQKYWYLGIPIQIIIIGGSIWYLLK